MPGTHSMGRTDGGGRRVAWKVSSLRRKPCSVRGNCGWCGSRSRRRSTVLHGVGGLSRGWAKRPAEDHPGYAALPGSVDAGMPDQVIGQIFRRDPAESRDPPQQSGSVGQHAKNMNERSGSGTACVRTGGEIVTPPSAREAARRTEPPLLGRDDRACDNRCRECGFQISGTRATSATQSRDDPASSVAGQHDAHDLARDLAAVAGTPPTSRSPQHALPLFGIGECE